MLSVIQSESVWIIQETHAAEDAAQEAFILAERNEVWGCSRWVKAMTSMQVRHRTRELRTQFYGQHQRTRVSTGAAHSHTPRQNSGNRNSCDWTRLTSDSLTLNRTSVQEGQEQAIDHFRFDLTVPLPRQAWQRFKTLATTLEETTQPSAQERPVGRTRWSRVLTTWSHSPSSRSVQATRTPLLLSLLAVNHRTWRRTEMTSRGPVQRTASAPWQEPSRSHAADSAVSDDMTQ